MPDSVLLALPDPLWVKIPLCILSGITYLALHFVRFSNGSGEKRLRTLAHGCSLLCTCFFWAIAEIPVLIATAVTSAFPLAIRICSAALFLLLCCLSFWISILHLLYSGKQVKKYWYLILCFIWWMPVVSWILTLYIYRTSKREWRVEQAKSACNAVRKESEICQTKYPILLVHGIFFRDWQYLNYWGRIPGELLRNGAILFYGRQQSAQSVQNSGRELAVQIQAVCKATGSPKVNLIAHSKEDWTAAVPFRITVPRPMWLPLQQSTRPITGAVLWMICCKRCRFPCKNGLPPGITRHFPNWETQIRISWQAYRISRPPTVPPFWSLTPVSPLLPIIQLCQKCTPFVRLPFR